MSDLAAHEKALVAFGQFMVNHKPGEEVDWERMGKLSAEVINGIPTVRATIAAPEVYVIFDGPPGPVSGRFVETETADGRSVGGNRAWEEYAGHPGLWRLGPFKEAS